MKIMRKPLLSATKVLELVLESVVVLLTCMEKSFDEINFLLGKITRVAKVQQHAMISKSLGVKIDCAFSPTCIENTPGSLSKVNY